MLEHQNSAGDYEQAEMLQVAQGSLHTRYQLKEYIEAA
jgi:hypothetical protein